MDEAAPRRQASRAPPAPARREEDHAVGGDVDDASEASFPASDPPAWMGMPPGGAPPHPTTAPVDRADGGRR